MRYLVILAALLAVGCGQKGALFLPDSVPESAPKEDPQQQSQQTADAPLKSGDVSTK